MKGNCGQDGSANVRFVIYANSHLNLMRFYPYRAHLVVVSSQGLFVLLLSSVLDLALYLIQGLMKVLFHLCSLVQNRLCKLYYRRACVCACVCLNI